MKVGMSFVLLSRLVVVKMKNTSQQTRNLKLPVVVHNPGNGLTRSFKLTPPRAELCVKRC